MSQWGLGWGAQLILGGFTYRSRGLQGGAAKKGKKSGTAKDHRAQQVNVARDGMEPRKGPKEQEQITRLAPRAVPSRNCQTLTHAGTFDMPVVALLRSTKVGGTKARAGRLGRDS